MSDRASLSDQPERRHFDAFVPLELREEITSAHAEVARLRAAAREVIADWDRNPEFEPVSGSGLREALNGGEHA